MSKTRILALGAALVLAGAACGGGRSGSGEPALRLGYFPNITHATAIVGVEGGIFEKHLGGLGRLETQTFTAGGQAVEALFAEGLDATYIGPSPAINAYIRSDGEAIRILAGATAGGAYFVVQPDVDNVQDLRGERLATPQLGNTQDTALRSWLGEQGLETQGNDPEVEILPQDNSRTLETFRTREIAGAWVPEPWASRLVVEAGGRVLVDERDLWPGGQYSTTLLIVRTDFLEEQPDVVRALIQAHVEADAFVNANEEEAKSLTGAAIERITGRRLPREVVDRAWASLTFTVDPIAASLRRSAEQAEELGFLDESQLEGIYYVTYVNNVLKSAGKPDIKVS